MMVDLNAAVVFPPSIMSSTLFPILEDDFLGGGWAGKPVDVALVPTEGFRHLLQSR